MKNEKEIKEGFETIEDDDLEQVNGGQRSYSSLTARPFLASDTDNAEGRIQIVSAADEGKNATLRRLTSI